tara:strand:- start:3432 stop:3659 length:228 start_codon:yes stop_codon:yes gene_type:complete
MPSITITISDKVHSALSSRAKKNLLSVREQIEDILRRSSISYKKRSSSKIKVDDKLVGIFSRQRSGRKKKSSKKK